MKIKVDFSDKFENESSVAQALAEWRKLYSKDVDETWTEIKAIPGLRFKNLRYFATEDKNGKEDVIEMVFECDKWEETKC